MSQKNKQTGLEKKLPAGLGQMKLHELQAMQQKYGRQVLGGYMRNPSFVFGKVDQTDHVNAQCALRNEPGYVCTRMLPADCADCREYQEQERQWKLQGDIDE